MSIETSLKRLRKMYEGHRDGWSAAWQRLQEATTIPEWCLVAALRDASPCEQDCFLAFLIDRCEWLDAELTAAKVDASAERVRNEQSQRVLNKAEQVVDRLSDERDQAKRERINAVQELNGVRDRAAYLSETLHDVEYERDRLVAENTKLARQLDLLEGSDARLVAIFDRCDAAIEAHKLTDEFGMVAYEDMVPTLLDKLDTSRRLLDTSSKLAANAFNSRDWWHDKYGRLADAALAVLAQHPPYKNCGCEDCKPLSNLNTVLENNDNGN